MPVKCDRCFIANTETSLRVYFFPDALYSKIIIEWVWSLLLNKMAVSNKSLLLVLSASGAVATVGGLMFWKWLKHHRDGHHHSSGGHGHHHSTFDNINIMLAYHYAPPSVYECVPESLKSALDYTSRLANICKRQKTVSII